MEAITAFYIDLDLSDVKLMYDYEHSEFVNPEDGQWDVGKLRSLFSSQEIDTADDDSKHTRLRLMDPAMTAKGCLEKDRRSSVAAAKKPEENTSGIFDGPPAEAEVPYRLLPVMKPGDIVKGHVVLDLKESVEAEQLTVSFKGGARVKVRVYTGKGYYDDTGSEKYVDSEIVLWGEGGSTEAAGGDLSDEFALLGSGTPTKGKCAPLPAGKHRFPFEFELPAEAIEAVPPLINSGHDYAHVVYRLKATLDKGKLWKRGNIVASRGIWVSKDWDIAQIPDFMSPVTAEETIGTGLLRRSGRITCRASLPRKAFLRRETITLRLEIENGDSNPIISVSARVVLGGRARCGTSKMKACRSIHIKSVKVSGEAISGDSVQNQTLELPIEFEEIDSNLIPSGTLDNCLLIDVKYEIVIKLKRKGIHRNVEVKVPVIIGSVNSSSFQ